VLAGRRHIAQYDLCLWEVDIILECHLLQEVEPVFMQTMATNACKPKANMQAIIGKPVLWPQGSMGKSNLYHPVTKLCAKVMC